MSSEALIGLPKDAIIGRLKDLQTEFEERPGNKLRWYDGTWWVLHFNEQNLCWRVQRGNGMSPPIE